MMPDDAAFHIMTCTIQLDYVTIQLWKLDNSIVPLAQMPHLTVGMYVCTNGNDRISPWNVEFSNSS